MISTTGMVMSSDAVMDALHQSEYFDTRLGWGLVLVMIVLAWIGPNVLDWWKSRR